MDRSLHGDQTNDKKKVVFTQASRIPQTVKYKSQVLICFSGYYLCSNAVICGFNTNSSSLAFEAAQSFGTPLLPPLSFLIMFTSFGYAITKRNITVFYKTKLIKHLSKPVT